MLRFTHFLEDFGQKTARRKSFRSFLHSLKSCQVLPPCVHTKENRFFKSFILFFVQAMKNFLPDQWWFLMHTSNMERRLNETEFLEKVKKTNEKQHQQQKYGKETQLFFFQAEADLRIFASKVTSHLYNDQKSLAQNN